MSDTAEATVATGPTRMEKILNSIERIGNKVPNPVLMFVYLIAFIFVLSTILEWIGVSVTETIAEPVPVTTEQIYYGGTLFDVTLAEDYRDQEYEIKEVTISIRGLLTLDGIQFIFTSFVDNFAGFSVVAVAFIAMLGAGAAEGAGMMDALIRKLVASAPRSLITFLIVLVGGLSSVASDAGYLILIPLAAVAFMTLGRHPLAGLAAGFAGVAATFMVNIIPQPTDALITEIANESILLIGGESLTVLNNYYFGVVSLLIMCLVATLLTEKVVEPRLGPWDRSLAGDDSGSADEELSAKAEAAEARGLKFALFGFLGTLALVTLITAPPGAPLRHPETGEILGATPFMDSLLFIIALFFLVAGVCYGIGAGTVKSADDVIAAITKTFSGMGGLILMFLMIAQFIAYFNYSNLPPVIAISLAEMLESANIGAVALMVGFIFVILILDFILPGALPKWAIFAPIFIPVFARLDVAPQTLLAAYRVGDSPVNTLTPLMVYFPFIVTVAQRYRKDVGIGTIISLMIPYAVVMGAIWIVLFVLWFVVGIPWGPGYSVGF